MNSFNPVPFYIARWPVGRGYAATPAGAPEHWLLALLLGMALATCPAGVRAATPSGAHAAASAPVKAEAGATGEAPASVIDLKKALREQMFGKSKLTLVISDKPEHPGTSSKPAAPASRAHPAAAHAAANDVAPADAHPAATAAPVKVATHRVVLNPRASRDYIRAKAAALVGHGRSAASDDHTTTEHGNAHWSYTGATGPQAWGQLEPEFATCASGKRQSPINIEESNTLQGPAEPLLFNYTPSNASVINNGHTVQVDVQGSNTLTVRGNNYTLVQLHFHSPSEEQVNSRPYAMVAHLVHQSAQGQLAVVAVLLDVGQASALIDTIWTYMPLDVEDQVRMPSGLLDLKGLLPQDQRYFQFLGSLTTPPCTEGVLWLVLKQPTPISAAQLRLFQQLYPNNARPLQALNNRPVRSAQ